MSNETLNGLDDVLVTGDEDKVISVEEHRKKKRAFHPWEVNGTVHKLKLQTSMIAKLENKYHDNLLNIISRDGVPPLSVMLTVVQAAIVPWEHGKSYQDIEKMYDSWVENNEGNQQKLLSSVVIPTMAVSGFFTPEQAESIMNSLDEAMDLI